jgi:hypothetical protein
MQKFIYSNKTKESLQLCMLCGKEREKLYSDEIVILIENVDEDRREELIACRTRTAKEYSTKS